MVKKLPEHSDWLFGDNAVSRINQIKAKQQALKSDVFKDSKRLAGILQKPRKLTERAISKTAKKKIENQQLPSKENCIIRRRADAKTSK